MLNRILLSAISLVATIFLNGSLHAEEEIACPPKKSFEVCSKAVAQKFKECSDSVTHMRNVRNDEAVNKCKEMAQANKERCKETCKDSPIQSSER